MTRRHHQGVLPEIELFKNSVFQIRLKAYPPPVPLVVSMLVFGFLAYNRETFRESSLTERKKKERVMATDYTICIGTVGQGLWQSPDGGESWVRMRTPFPLESRVRALTRHPTEPHTLFAGADSGLYLSRDNGAAWAHVSAPEPRLNIWSLAVVPTDPETLFAGTSPSAVYRSRDGGHQWEPLALELAEECAIGTPR